ncbi:MAG: hypothetical protein JXR88_00870 [Clostridia bacterium]|nr:hypothetical protein [Clostridia bacterium]
MILPLFSGMQKFYKQESIFNAQFHFEVETFRRYIEIFLRGIEKRKSYEL